MFHRVWRRCRVIDTQFCQSSHSKSFPCIPSISLRRPSSEYSTSQSYLGLVRYHRIVTQGLEYPVESCILHLSRKKKLHVLLMCLTCPWELGDGLGGVCDPLPWGPGDWLGDGVLSRFLAGNLWITHCNYMHGQSSQYTVFCLG